MLNTNKRYDAHPKNIKEYKYVFSRTSLPKDLPLTSTQSGRSYIRLVLPLMTLYLVITQLCYLYSPEIFLGWLTHFICFIALGLIIYDLCPPEWTQTIEINLNGVSVESFGAANHERWSVPLTQYRGVVPVLHKGLNQKRQPFREYGVALKHPDPTKTILLMLSPLPNEKAVTHYANLLGVHALTNERFTLELESKSA